jgi:hypothetical protein
MEPRNPPFLGELEADDGLDALDYYEAMRREGSASNTDEEAGTDPAPLGPLAE